MKKKWGIIDCKLVKLWPHFVDAVCTKTGREMTFQFSKLPIHPKCLAMIERAIGEEWHTAISTRIQDQEGMYWFCGFAMGERKNMKKKAMQTIKYCRLLEECSQDGNPVRPRLKGTSRIRRADFEYSSTSGRIGSTIHKLVERPGKEEFRKLHKEKEDRTRELLNARHQINIMKDRYRNWRRKNYGTMEEFLEAHRQRGIAQKRSVELYLECVIIKQRLDIDEKRWKELKKISYK